MNKQLYKLLVNAVDEEGPFFQNFYAYGNDSDDSIETVMSYLEEYKYKNIEVVEIELYDVNYLPNDVIQVDEFNGYIQNVKFAYLEEE